MIRCLLLALALLLAPLDARATIALVAGQTTSCTVLSGSAVTCTLTSNPTTGNFVAVAWDTNDNTAGETMSCKDGAATPNTYANDGSSPFRSTNAVTGYAGVSFLANAPSNANKAITCTANHTGILIDAYVAEFSGVATSTPEDGSAVTQSSATSSTAISTPSFTPTVSGDVLIAATLAGQNISSATSPWNLIGTVENGDAGAYAILTSSSAQAINETQAPAGEWVIIIAGFKAAAGGATCPKTLLLMGVGC